MDVSLASLKRDLEQLGVSFTGERPSFAGSKRPSDAMVDRWARAAALAEPDLRQAAIWAIREAVLEAGIVPASIQELYIARAREKWSNKTVPAMNLRGWTYHSCRCVFRTAKAMNSGLFIFEQAIAEQVFAAQPPAEFTAGVLAAALREGYTGPVFIQADHAQVNAAAYRKDSAAEIARLEKIMREQVASSFYNIDIDASTLVDLSFPTIVEQQRLNAEVTAHFTKFVRALEPEGITISLGAEIGEVGHHTTTPEELRAFMQTYPKAIATSGQPLVPVSKISVNSGTYHGGKVMPDGTLAPVNVDYATLTTLSDICRREFEMGGVVQHGASTLPRSQLAKFPGAGAIEIHLALGFNNLIFDHPALPEAIRQEIRDYTFANHRHERAPGENDKQFLYNLRKKAWKVVKQRFWDLPEPIEREIMASLEAMFTGMFLDMNAANTRDLVAGHTTLKKIAPAVPDVAASWCS